MSDKAIQAPFPGVFYRRPNPDANPFVQEGDMVEADTIVGVIEVMKMFHELAAGQAGRIATFAVEDEDVVSAGQDLVILT